MQRLDLNLASHPFRNNTLLWTACVVSVAALIAVSTWNGMGYFKYSSRLDDARETIGNLEQRKIELSQRQEKAERAIKKFDVETLVVQAGKANEVIEWRAFSWTRLLNRLSAVQPNGVKMTEVRPEFRGGRSAGAGAEFDELGRATAVPVLVEGLGRGFDDFWELQELLLRSEHFGRVDPQRLSREDSGEIYYQLRFVYYPLAATEEAELAEADAGEADAEAEPEEVAATTEPAPEVEEQAAVAPRRQLPVVTDEETDPVRVEPTPDFAAPTADGGQPARRQLPQADTDEAAAPDPAAAAARRALPTQTDPAAADAANQNTEEAAAAPGRGQPLRPRLRSKAKRKARPQEDDR